MAARTFFGRLLFRTELSVRAILSKGENFMVLPLTEANKSRRERAFSGVITSFGIDGYFGPVWRILLRFRSPEFALENSTLLCPVCECHNDVSMVVCVDECVSACCNMSRNRDTLKPLTLCLYAPFVTQQRCRHHVGSCRVIPSPSPPPFFTEMQLRVAGKFARVE